MTEEALKLMIEAAAEQGARRALASIGLHDDNAGRDVEELRGLLESWRQARQTAWKTTVKWLTTGFLTLIALALWTKLGGPGK